MNRDPASGGWEAAGEVSRSGPTKAVRVGLAGLGYWGRNLARNLEASPHAELRWCCDPGPEGDRRVPDRSQTRFTADLDQLLDDAELEAVVLATPVSTHAELAARVLRADKHCLVEKPLAQSAADAERVLETQRASGKVLMVGHVLEYHPALTRLKQLVEGGELGTIHYIYGQRLNLGELRADENALWSLGAHDVSVLLHLAGEEPTEIWARGESYMREGVVDVVFAFLRFPSGLAAHLHLSWLDPHKSRGFTVVGSKRMATLDDTSADRKLTVYDKGFDENVDTYGEYITRSGEIRALQIPDDEPLRLEVEHFLACVRDGRRPLSDGASGLRVVRVLEGLQRSLDESQPAGRPRPAGTGRA